MSLHLDWCSYEAAKYAVEKWHYSGTMPVNKTARLGVWEDTEFIGCVVFSCGSAGAGSIGKSFGLDNTNVAELARVALRNHVSEVTRIVRIALSMLKKSQPGLKLIVSYADPEHGHIGAIYQGGNWFFVGRSSPDTAYIDKHGKRWHSRSVSETGYKIHCGVRTRCPKPSTMRSVTVEPKYKYLYPLDKAMRRQIAPLAQPYPKRGRGEIDNAAETNPQTGGASPTRPLCGMTGNVSELISTESTV